MVPVASTGRCTTMVVIVDWEVCGGAESVFCGGGGGGVGAVAGWGVAV
jgi:hypothetical protein